MDTYYENNHADTYPEIGPARLPTWCAFALGGIVTFLFVYIGIARPAAREMSMMRRQMSTLEQSIWEIAGHKESVQETNSLLAILNEQRAQTMAAQESFVEIQQVHQQLLAEAERVHTAMIAVSELGSLKDMLLANSDRADQAAEVLSVSEDIYHRLANAASTTELALQVGGDLLTLRDDLIDRNGEMDSARTQLNQLLVIRQSLHQDGKQVDVAKEKVDQLIALKDSIVDNTGDLADAIETLELTTELGRRFHDAAVSFDNIRHWMVEVVAMEPLLERARGTIDPLLELGNLHRMEPAQLRELARSVTRQYEAHIASKPKAGSSIDTATLEGSIATE